MAKGLLSNSAALFARVFLDLAPAAGTQTPRGILGRVFEIRAFGAGLTQRRGGEALSRSVSSLGPEAEVELASVASAPARLIISKPRAITPPREALSKRLSPRIKSRSNQAATCGAILAVRPSADFAAAAAKL
jgi:hypothetical protein